MTSSQTQSSAPAEALARIDLALDRLESALTGGLHTRVDPVEAARHARLRAAVSGALGQLDALIAAQNADGNTAGGDR